MTPDPSRLIAAIGTAGRSRPEPYPWIGGWTAGMQCTYNERIDPVHFYALWQNPPRLGPRFNHTAAAPEPTAARGRRVSLREPIYEGPGDDSFDRAARSPRCAELVGVLHSFRHADTKQLCCWTGTHPTNATKYLKPLHYSGILDRGSLQSYRISGSTPYLYGLHDGPPARRYFRQLDDQTAQALLGITDDRRPRFSSRHLRHNVALTEATLRMLETSEHFVAVDGELRANARDLLPDEDHERIDTGLSADAVWYRHDGLRVAVELVMSLNRDHIARKMARWASVMADTDRRNNLVVLWLNGVNPGHGKAAATLRKIHAETFEYGKVEHGNHVLADPGTVKHVQSCNLIGSWFDWYPQPFQVSHAGRELFVTGTQDGARWQAAALAHPESLPAPDQSQHPLPRHQLTPVFMNVPALFAPEWMESTA